MATGATGCWSGWRAVPPPARVTRRLRHPPAAARCATAAIGWGPRAPAVGRRQPRRSRRCSGRCGCDGGGRARGARRQPRHPPSRGRLEVLLQPRVLGWLKRRPRPTPPLATRRTAGRAAARRSSARSARGRAARVSTPRVAAAVGCPRRWWRRRLCPPAAGGHHPYLARRRGGAAAATRRKAAKRFLGGLPCGNGGRRPPCSRGCGRDDRSDGGAHRHRSGGRSRCRRGVSRGEGHGDSDSSGSGFRRRHPRCSRFGGAGGSSGRRVDLLILCLIPCQHKRAGHVEQVVPDARRRRRGRHHRDRRRRRHWGGRPGYSNRRPHGAG